MFALGLLVIITLGLNAVALSAIYRKLLSIERAVYAPLTQLVSKETTMDDYADLILATEESVTTQRSAINALNGFADRIDAAVKAAGGTTVPVATIAEITAKLRENSAALAFAIDAQAAPGPMPADNDPDEPTPVEPTE